MATNPYISRGHRPEQNLYEDLIVESIKFYGEDIYYLPRELVNRDNVFLDDVPSHFSDAYKVEVYIENTDGFDGEGDLFTKFGIELRDQATFVIARRRWRELVGDRLEQQQFRPREGDVIYLPLSQSLFQIMKVETESPFYQLNQLPLFRMQCELFEYNDEDFDTGIDEIDVVEAEHAYQYEIQMISPETIDAELTASINVQGEVVQVDIIDGGSGYTRIPTITVNQPSLGDGYFGDNSLNSTVGHGYEGVYSQTSDHGSIEFFIHPVDAPSLGEYTAMFVGGGDEVSELSKRYIIGYDSLGAIVFGTYSDGFVYTTNANLQIGDWNHIGVFVEDQVMRIYVDGVLSDTLTFPETQNFISSSTFRIGTLAAGLVNGVDWKPVDGKIDEFLAQAGIYSQILDPRIESDGTLHIPDHAFVEDGYTAHLNHFDGESAVLEAVITDGVVTGVTIVNSGHLYTLPPSLEVEDPGTLGFYATGSPVRQEFDGYDMEGEVTSWNSETLVLKIAHMGATDGKYHDFTTDRAIIGDEAVFYPQSINKDYNEIQPLSQNKIFDDFENDFVDFSESNPFGDIS